MEDKHGEYDLIVEEVDAIMERLARRSIIDGAKEKTFDKKIRGLNKVSNKIILTNQEI